MAPYLPTIFRSVLSFIALLLVCRAIGKKFDMVVPVVLGVLVAIVSLDRNESFSDGIIALATWGLLTVILGVVTSNFPQARNVVLGKPTVLIEQGKVLEKNLKKVRMTLSDMMTMLREKNAFKLADVEFAALESDGQMSVMKKSDSVPVTPSTAGIAVQNEAAPKVVLENGVALRQALLEEGKDAGWLLQEIKKQGARDYNDVFLAQLDGKGNLYVDLKNDTVTQPPGEPNKKSRLLLLASLKKTQADLEQFALETKNKQAKIAYEQSAASLSAVIRQVQNELQK